MAGSLLLLDDLQLLAQCRVETYRGSGPGGQKRNKTSSAVRLTHGPSGISATAADSRSQAENKARALGRLRLKLAVELRQEIDPAGFRLPEWLGPLRRNRRLSVSPRNPLYPAAAGLVLDLLKAMHGNPGDVAEMLGTSTSSVIKFLEDEPQLWGKANRIRVGFRIQPLTHRG